MLPCPGKTRTLTAFEIQDLWAPGLVPSGSRFPSATGVTSSLRVKALGEGSTALCEKARPQAGDVSILPVPHCSIKPISLYV